METRIQEARPLRENSREGAGSKGTSTLGALYKPHKMHEVTSLLSRAFNDEALLSEQDAATMQARSRPLQMNSQL